MSDATNPQSPAILTRRILALGLGIGLVALFNLMSFVAAFLLNEGIAILTTVIGADIVISQRVVDWYFARREDDTTPDPGSDAS